jgi:hypothetical protein
MAKGYRVEFVIYLSQVLRGNSDGTEALDVDTCPVSSAERATRLHRVCRGFDSLTGYERLSI